VEYTVWGTNGRIRRLVDVPVAGNPMVHDCSITERYVVIYDLPVTFDLDAALAGGGFPYRWDEGYGARVGLLPRDGEGSDVTWYEVEPCYVFHPLNAYDDGDRVVLDVIRHPRMFATDTHGPNEGPPALWRWTVDTAAGTVTESQLDDRPAEFPRVDERLVGRRHRWGWTTALGLDGDDVAFEATGLIRYDLELGGSEVIDLGPGRHPGEAVFVPRGDDAAEDDGWFLTLVHDRTVDRSELVVLDAGAPHDGPVARVHLPARVPLGFHGNWVPST